MDAREHPLRRRYAWQLALGLAVLGAALLVLLGGEEPARGSSPGPAPVPGHPSR